MFRMRDIAIVFGGLLALMTLSGCLGAGDKVTCGQATFHGPLYIHTANTCKDK